MDGIDWYCASPVLKIIFAACAAIDELQRMLDVYAWRLAAHIRCCSSIPFQHSRRMYPSSPSQNLANLFFSLILSTSLTFRIFHFR